LTAVGEALGKSGSAQPAFIGQACRDLKVSLDGVALKPGLR
jgi:hypothetical protein